MNRKFLTVVLRSASKKILFLKLLLFPSFKKNIKFELTPRKNNSKIVVHVEKHRFQQPWSANQQTKYLNLKKEIQETRIENQNDTLGPYEFCRFLVFTSRLNAAAVRRGSLTLKQVLTFLL